MQINNVILVVAIILIIAVIIIVIVLWRPIFDNKQKYGVWQAELPSECIMKTDSCEGGGTRTVTETCMPTVRGVGCLNDQGKQVYGTRAVVQECQPVCQVSVFQIIDEGTCVVPGIPSSTCVEAGMTGTRTTTSQCVINESEGVNMCTRVEVVPILGPTGVPGFADQLIVYQVGETITETENCTDYVNPICGDWVFIEPAPLNTTVCQANKNIFLQDICNLGDVLNPLATTLIEGYAIEALECSTGSSNPEGDPSLNPTPNCVQLVPPECSDTVVDPTTVAAGTFDPAFLGIQCAGINSDLDRPGCMSLCRKQNPDPAIYSGIGAGGFTQLLTSLILIRVPGRGYLNVEQSPPVDQLGVVHRDTIPFATTDGNLSPLQLIDLDATDGRDCAMEERQFATSSLLRLAFREEINDTTVLTQIAITQSSDYVGWMVMNDTSNPQWLKMQTDYGEEGILAKDAPQFQVIINSPFVDEQLSGFPANMLGTIRISLKTATGGNLVVPLIDINRAGDTIVGNFTLNNVEALLFPLDTDLATRSDRELGNCNLQYDPNGLLFQPLGNWQS